MNLVHVINFFEGGKSMFLRSYLLAFGCAAFGLSYAAEMPVNIQDMQPGVIYVSQPTSVPQNLEPASASTTEQTPVVVELVEPCQCYCSDLCGYRARKADDTPQTDPATGIRFCKPRDKNNYEKNGCNTKPMAELKPELGPLCPSVQ